MSNYHEQAKEALQVARKISRSQQRAYTLKILKEQNGVCAVCGLPIELKVMGNKSDYALDHCHDYGLVRGVLHRSCNASLGKLENAIGSWGAKSMDMQNIINFLEKALMYYRQPFQKVIYPDHKTDAEKAEAKKLKAAKAKAIKDARTRMAERRKASSA